MINNLNKKIKEQQDEIDKLKTKYKKIRKDKTS